MTRDNVPDLPFGEGAAYARGDDPDTSHEAADQMRGRKASALETRVYEALRNLGGFGTSEEVADHLGLDLQSISPRFCPMETLGLIRRTTRRKAGKSGRQRIVWETRNGATPGRAPTESLKEEE